MWYFSFLKTVVNQFVRVMRPSLIANMRKLSHAESLTQATFHMSGPGHPWPFLDRFCVTPWHVELFAPERGVAGDKGRGSARNVRFVRVTRRTRSGARMGAFESAWSCVGARVCSFAGLRLATFVAAGRSTLALRTASMRVWECMQGCAAQLAKSSMARTWSSSF